MEMEGLVASVVSLDFKVAEVVVSVGEAVAVEDFAEEAEVGLEVSVGTVIRERYK
jgi:hypothetical protein